MKEQIIISSFSGGKTSAYMTYLLKQEYGDSLRVVFMNTGLEHEKTLEFVNKCDKAWNLKIDWIEAVVNHKDKISTKHRYVTYDSANRDNSIAKEIVYKYGLFGVGYLHCTREFKLRPFSSWKKENKLTEFNTAIGIRADEMDRVNENYEKLKLTYPLLDKNITKSDVDEFWKLQSFELGLPERYGNCKMCWKKSEKKIILNANDNPEWLDEIKDLEKITDKGADKMFRKNRSAQDILDLRTNNVDMFKDFGLDGCQSSCDVFAQ
jgi:hypothetical protein